MVVLKKEPEGLAIRYSYLVDENELIQWLEDPETLKWFPMSNREEIVVGAKNWIGFSRVNASLTATLNNIPVGIATLFLMPYRKTKHQALFFFFLDPKHRRQGIGTSLLKNILNLAEKYFKLEGVFAEIFDDAPIIPLLKNFDFKDFALQPFFVKEAKDQYLSRTLFEKSFSKMRG